jgi:hypothetical protein
MAGSWGTALNEAANMAAFMKDIEEESYRYESEVQRTIINETFWNEDKQFFAYGKNLDGSFRNEQTILPAVPIYFRMADRDKASLALKSIAGNTFTTNWGVRILRDDSPLFKPSGYHYGSVWPLFTGWASLAEYATGNPIQGFSHMMNNLVIYRNWGLGFAEEVLNGAEYKPSGVCAHQCWSETMVLQPAIEGLLGLEIRAQEKKIVLAPQLPPDWDSLTVNNIRMADQLVNFRFLRSDESCVYDFSLENGAPVHMSFMPVFPAGTRILDVTLDDRQAPYTSFKSDHSMTLILSFDLGSSSVLKIRTDGGLSVLPVISDPKPGEKAPGMRIISTRLHGTQYQVDLEGPAGTSGTLELWTGDAKHLSAENADFLTQTGRISRFNVNFDNTGSKYVTKTVTIKTE